ncbi:Brisc and brca1-a complex member 1-like [Plakobranchus ocellatus]|uniref:BRISC and BRCA1-A complex member 1 n=1 Tax=Plakobranchus ocellatus TaxID=259542 RepID=A0AAV3ZWT6_9GAST|nr:Brisc and brca1-a complex member 1-like [Plakobranchus ocellatus]
MMNESAASESSSSKSKMIPTQPSHSVGPSGSAQNIKSSLNAEVNAQAQLHECTLPSVDCPEKIIICLDLSQEMNTTTFRSRAGDKYSGLELAKRAIKMFVMHKSQMNPKHQFAFLVFREEATMIQSFTSRAQDILNTLDESEIEPQESDSLNLTHFFETIKENVELPETQGDPQVMPPPYIIRVLLFFGRSHSVPINSCQKVQRELESSPYFFTDVLYIHEPPSEENKCEEIFKVFCDLDHNGMSYIFEQSKYTTILNNGAKLLAHPLQRPRQLDAVYKIGSPIPTPTPQPPCPAEERVY